jgi:hypothetical protein
MGEDMARALGASSAKTVMVAGKECVLRPLGIRELTEVERDCLQRYKRHYLETIASNADLLAGDKGARLLDQQIIEAARWDIGNLPAKFVFDPKRIKPTDLLKEWLASSFGLPTVPEDLQARRLASAALDQESLSVAEYERLTGEKPIRTKVGYVNWWITGCYEGMISFAWICLRHNGVSREQVEESFGARMSSLVDTTREIENLTSPQLGNG